MRKILRMTKNLRVLAISLCLGAALVFALNAGVDAGQRRGGGSFGGGRSGGSFGGSRSSSSSFGGGRSGSSFRTGVDYSSPRCRYSAVYRTSAPEGTTAIYRNGRARSRAPIHQQRAGVDGGRAGVSIGARERPSPGPIFRYSARCCANDTGHAPIAATG